MESLEIHPHKSYDGDIVAKRDVLRLNLELLPEQLSSDEKKK